VQPTGRLPIWQAVLLFKKDDDRKYCDGKYQYQPLETVTFKPTGEV